MNEIEILIKDKNIKKIKYTYRTKICRASYRTSSSGNYMLITIPLEMRELLDIEINDRFRIGVKDDEIVFVKVKTNIGQPIQKQKEVYLPTVLIDKYQLKVNDYLLMRVEQNRIHAVIERGI